MKTFITVSMTDNPVRVPSQAGRQPYTLFNAVSWEGKKPRPLQVRVWGNAGRNVLVSVCRGQVVTIVCEDKPAFHESEDVATGRITRVEVARALDVLLPFSRTSCVLTPSIREDTDPMFLAALPSTSSSRGNLQELSGLTTEPANSAVSVPTTRDVF